LRSKLCEEIADVEPERIQFDVFQPAFEPPGRGSLYSLHRCGFAGKRRSGNGSKCIGRQNGLATPACSSFGGFKSVVVFTARSFAGFQNQ
jgi:hypothetical protein